MTMMNYSGIPITRTLDFSSRTKSGFPSLSQAMYLKSESEQRLAEQSVFLVGHIGKGFC